MSGKSKVVVIRHIGDEALGIIQANPNIDLVLWKEDTQAPRSWILENIKGASGILVVMGEPVTRELVDAAGPSLKVVSTMSVGYEHVDQPLLAQHKIRLGFTPDVLTEAVADITVMLAFMASRNVGETLAIVQEGKWSTVPWSPFLFTGPQLSISGPSNPSARTRLTAGFLGFGRIAQATLHRLIAFGVTDVLFTARSDSSKVSQEILDKYPTLHSVKQASNDELAAGSDVVFVLTPGGKETYHLVGEEFLKKMKSNAVLVNTARGTCVDSDALAKALKEKWIWAAGLDVVEGEPNISADHPLVKEPRAVILPHIGSATTETRVGMATRAARNIVAGVLGEKMEAEVDLSRFKSTV
ncbi:hypothetical protein SISNIDRAFT_450016 [Sistotremastrum niveocremeum HHB9708]|uniref:Glyoxylate reductase n=1 Tax=Sistotremastrum niveocremeum HHB9708 TaxID=1314777 RepID=A0A164YTP5_9AGAM|nr:hypothetical protein SISNIDRAFT_450016 [Sistotremastrum niveocremeum HHB9708]